MRRSQLIASAIALVAVTGAGWFGYGTDKNASSKAALERARQESPHDLNEAAAKLSARLQADPNDADGWRLLVRTYVLLGDQEKAADAAKHLQALGTSPSDPASKSSLGEDLVAANGGVVSDDAKKLFEAALTADATDPRARFFLGLAAAQAGDPDGGLNAWLKLEADSPEDAPWLDGLRANISRLAEEMKLGSSDLAQRRTALAPTRKPAVVAAAAPAPAASAEPSDAEFWNKLGASYAQNGQPERALTAFRQASILSQPGAPQPQRAPTLQASAPSPAVAPGPTGSDIAAAARMTADERSQMVNSMVERLADRLASNPDDVDGWLRLARAYKVLGKPDKSLEALSGAMRADPKRSDIRAEYEMARAAMGKP
jgi:cytochrome c-type biogenesis protein CcmH